MPIVVLETPEPPASYAAGGSFFLLRNSTVCQLLSLRTDIVRTMEETGEEITNDVGRATENYIRDHINDLVEGNVRFIEARMTSLKHYVEILADMATDTASNPGHYQIRDVNPPRNESRSLSAQLLFSETVKDRGNAPQRLRPPLVQGRPRCRRLHIL